MTWRNPVLREMDSPRSFAALLIRRLGLQDDREAHAAAEEVIHDAMSEALQHAKQTAEKSGRWAPEAIDSLRNGLGK